MTIALITLAFLASLCFFGMMSYRRRLNQVREAAAKEWEELTAANGALIVQLNGARAGQQLVKKYCDEWADIIE